MLHSVILDLLQKIPRKLSNGKIIHYYVNYSIVGNSRKIPSTPLEGNVFKYTVGLSKGHCYRITIDATTSVGFNQSLQHEPLTVCTGTKQKGLYCFQALSEQHQVTKSGETPYTCTCSLTHYIWILEC